MFFVVISRVKDKVLLLARLMLVVCLLVILTSQLYSIVKSSGTLDSLFEKVPPDALPVEQKIK